MQMFALGTVLRAVLDFLLSFTPGQTLFVIVLLVGSNPITYAFAFRLYRSAQRMNAPKPSREEEEDADMARQLRAVDDTMSGRSAVKREHTKENPPNGADDLPKQ